MNSGRRWSESRWDLWAKVYDPLTRGLQTGRRRAIRMAEIAPDESVLIPGAGTGLDLPLLPPGVRVTAVEQSRPMIDRLLRRADALGMPLTVVEGDARATDLPSGAFDVILLHLILAVVDAPLDVLREAARVLRPSGKIIVFDKFAPDDVPLSRSRRLLNRFSRLVATDVTLQLGPLADAAELRIIHREPAGLAGVFQAAILNKLQL